MDAELLQHVVGDAEVALVLREADDLVGVDRVQALILQAIGAQLVGKADAAPFLRQVQQHAAALRVDRCHAAPQLLAAVAAQAAEQVAGEAGGMQAHRHRVLPLRGIADHDGDVFMHAVGLAEQHEAAILGFGQRHACLTDPRQGAGTALAQAQRFGCADCEQIAARHRRGDRIRAAGAHGAGDGCRNQLGSTEQPDRRTLGSRAGGMAGRIRQLCAALAGQFAQPVAVRWHGQGERDDVGAFLMAHRGHAVAAQDQLRIGPGERLQCRQGFVVQALDRLHQRVAGGIAQQDGKSAAQIENGTLGLAHVLFSSLGIPVRVLDCGGPARAGRRCCRVSVEP